MSWSLPMGIALLVTALSISAAIGIHWLALRVLWRYGRPRLVSFGGHGIGILVLGCIVAHLLEIGVFALGIFITAAWEGQMHLTDEFRQKNLDLWYYSAAFYTSLGADRPPTAGLRVFVTSEALTGLILITWTASFLFILMQEVWGSESQGGNKK
jgi:hypothetical protein